ncbi:MAG: hypothetical protein D6690_04590 [Nitrospirae bacterium]|nr:MAG: hypothetical protein D6690_04590 [Nitrospirota bacterium]
MSEIIDYRRGTRMHLGSGYDVLARTVKRSPLKPIQSGKEFYGDTDTDLRLVENASELHEFLQIGVEGVYDALMFKASVKSEFLLETNINSYSLFIVVRSSYVKEVEYADQPELSEEALRLIQRGQFTAFRQAYGDHYVASLTRGGELYGLIRIDTSSESERMELKMALKASGIGWSARTDLQSQLSKKVSTKSIRVRVRANGIANFRQPTTVADLIKLVEDLPQKVQAGGTPVKAELAPLTEFPQYTQAVVTFDSDTRYALFSLSRHYAEYVMLRNDIDFMLSPSATGRFNFDKVSKTTVRQQRTRVEQQLRTIDSLSDQLIHQRIRPNDRRITGFMDAYRFRGTLRLPNPIEEYRLSDVRVFPLRYNTRGDAEMAGHRPKIWITATLSTPANRRVLNLRVHVKMQESKRDWTTFEDSLSTIAVDLRTTGLKIVSFKPTRGSLYAQAGKNDHNWHWYPGRDLIKQAYCRSDTKGKETGRIGAEKIQFNAVRVEVASLAPPKPPKPVTVGAFATRVKKAVQFWAHPPAARLKLPVLRPTTLKKLKDLKTARLTIRSKRTTR